MSELSDRRAAKGASDERFFDSFRDALRQEAQALIDLRDRAIVEITQRNRLKNRIDELKRRQRDAAEDQEMESLEGQALATNQIVDRLKAEVQQAESSLYEKIAENRLAQVPIERREQARQLLLEEKKALLDLSTAASTSEWAASKTFFNAVEDCWRMAVASGDKELIDAQLLRLETARVEKQRVDLAQAEHLERTQAVRDEYQAQLDRLKAE